MILSAAYALWLYRRVVFGALEKESLKAMLDLSRREKVILYPLVALIILFGVYPAPIFDVTAASVDALINNYTASLQGSARPRAVGQLSYGDCGTMTPEILTTSLQLSVPELMLAVGAMVLLMVGVFSGEKSVTLVNGLAVALLIMAGLVLVLLTENGEAFNGAFLSDPFARFMKVLTLIGSITAMVMTVGHAKAERIDKFEFPVLIVLATLGMMLMISANDMMALYMGLELQSLALYVVAAINRDSLRSTEAGLKYFVLGALSSGMLLYGMSLVYGYTGHTGFDEIAAAIAGGERSLGLIFGLVFLLAGIAFKISAVPFHMWTPDVYEGAPTPVTAFFSAAPKVAAMALFTPHRHRRLRAGDARLAADRRVHLHRLDGARRLRGESVRRTSSG